MNAPTHRTDPAPHRAEPSAHRAEPPAHRTGPSAHRTAASPPPPRRPDESMSLLRELLDNPLDAGYRTAPRSAAPGPGRPLTWRQVLVVVAAFVIGAGAVWSARELRSPEGTVTARTVLLDQIVERRAVGDELQAANESRQIEIEELRAAALEGADQDVLEELAVLGVASGMSRVSGPGIVVELTDSEAAQAGEAGTEEERVKDIDLQVLVNGLWASGAEAIAVDGQRLSSTSAIRAAGQTILVNLAPVASPYTVEVIGDPVELQTRLARTVAGAHLGVLRSSFGIRSEITVAEDLVLSAPTLSELRYAEPFGGEATAASDVGAQSPGAPTQGRPTDGEGD